ncbi:MAG: type II toxin-antitoxin system RelE/ParE family toxin [Candidatus Omnitrophica bacterium]|nr:type II toxin-antitoxin system RelE/ParE family toxin [Candidatus Omnitrophota bacterium]
MRPCREEYVFYQGEKFQVEFYFNQKGELPAKEYFDLADRQVKIKLLAMVKYIAENGRMFDEGKFRIVNKKEKIYEFKPLAERFFNFFYEGKKIVLTNGYRKKGQKVDIRELAKAIQLKRDYEQRVEEETYYE